MGTDFGNRSTDRIGIIADDLTGASDTSLAFHMAGRGAWVLPRFGSPNDDIRWSVDVPAACEALAVNTQSRHLAPMEARNRIAQAFGLLRGLGFNRFYQKIDSTLRGNLSEEISEALAHSGHVMALVAPALPEARRITVGGYQMVDSLPVNLSPVGRDPLSPVNEAHLPTLLAARTSVTVDHLPLRHVMAGWQEVAGILAEHRQRGVRLVVADAATRDDLDTLARVIASSPWPILPVGSAGLAGSLAGQRSMENRARLLFAPAASSLGRFLGKTPPVLVVSGSSHPATLRQVQFSRSRSRVLRADIKQLLLTGSQELDILARQALQGLLAGLDMVIATSLSRDDVDAAQALGRELGLSPWQVGVHIGERLGELVAYLVEQTELSGLVVAGGETAAAVCAALPGESIQIIGEVLPTIPVGLLGKGGLRLVTKSGGFGEADALARILDHLRQVHGSEPMPHRLA